MHLNSVIMALAGVERIFGLIDEKAEIDNGDTVREKMNGRFKTIL